MAFCTIDMNSTASLGKMTSFNAIVPEGKPGPFPVLYLLHGYSDNHTAWTRRTSIERYVQDLPLIVVMPDGDHSFYCDAQNRPAWRFETFIADELVKFVDSAFNTIRAPEGRAVAGLSMGGYGAIKLALKFPDTYCAGISFSGALMAGNRVASPEWSNASEWLDIFGPSPQNGPNDTVALATALAAPESKHKPPAIWIDCGSSDFLIEENQKFTAVLIELGIEHEYMEFDGGHSWEYWDAAIQRTLPWLKQRLGIGEVPAPVR